MADRKKTIEGLKETEILLTNALDRSGTMTLIGAFKCRNNVTDAIILLKEQEPVDPVLDYWRPHGGSHFKCGNCG